VDHVPRKRLYGWGCVLLVFVIVGVGLAVRGSDAVAVARARSSSILYGIRGSGAVSEPQYPGGADTACTEAVLSKTSGEWRCLSWSVNIRRAVVVRPRRYEGPCAHVVVDQMQGAWTCLGRNPVPDEEVPPDGLPRLPALAG
jgi:hypothetical protein